MNAVSTQCEKIMENVEVPTYSNQLTQPEISWEHRAPLFAAELLKAFSGKEVCLLGLAREFVLRTQLESCGQCLFCREGLQQAEEVLTKALDRVAEPQDPELLKELGETMLQGSACPLGRLAAEVILATVGRFAREYESHARTGRCSVKAGIEAILPGYFQINSSAGALSGKSKR